MAGSKDFADLFQDLCVDEDTVALLKTQKKTLHCYEETNEMMRQFVHLSESTYTDLLHSYTSHTKTLNQLKYDLESCFGRIRLLKNKLNEKYPEAFAATADAIRELQLRHDFEDQIKFDEKDENEENIQSKLCAYENPNHVITNQIPTTSDETNKNKSTNQSSDDGVSSRMDSDNLTDHLQSPSSVEKEVDSVNDFQRNEILSNSFQHIDS